MQTRLLGQIGLRFDYLTGNLGTISVFNDTR
jgi:hypothetical protein